MRDRDAGFAAMNRLARVAEATGLIVDRNDVRSIRLDVPAGSPMVVTFEVYPTPAFLSALAAMPLPERRTDADPE